jgi:MFS family permease
VVTLIAIFFLRVPPRPPGVQARPLSLKSILDTSREVLAHARVDPTFGLILLASFVIRSDFFVTQSFMSVWVMGASKLQGIDSPQALKTVGLCSMTWQLTAAVSPLFLGYIADRFSRMGMLIGSLAFAAVAFTSTLFVHRVDGIAILVVFGAIGAAEMAQTIASQAAYGERAPPGLRGSGIGYFVLTGTISVVVISYVSGILFDKLGFIAPFLFLALLNILFVFAAAYFMLKRRGAKLAVATP